MDTIPNIQRNQSGIGPGSGVSDDVQSRLPAGGIFDKQDQEVNSKSSGQSGHPHELANIVPRLGDIFVSVLDIKRIFRRAISNPSVSKEQAEILENMDSKLDEANIIIAELTSELDKLELGK